MRLTQNLRKFLALDSESRRVLLTALVVLPFVTLGLRLAGLRRCQRWLARATGGPRVQGLTSDVQRRIQRTVGMVCLAARHALGAPTCLPQSLACWWLLRRQGIDSDLRIGTRKENGQFEAHAWVEYQGLVLNDRSDVQQRFTPFAEAIEPFGKHR